ncbi:MAG: MFS transporter [Methylococcales bacterium]|jgi:MFS family permease|nr:MFS transporter [Methylococcales bacterium]MBT7409012.1 MFS transporter [Methylococcales bacterium]
MSASSTFTYLAQKRFAPYFWTQFLGALNDNIFKNALNIFIAIQPLNVLPLDSDILINICLGIFIIPFFLFSAMAGQIADKWDKAYLTRNIKMFEIMIMSVAVMGFLSQSFILLIVLLFFMGLQSTLFGPIKYSYLPQHLDDNELVAGTGLVGMGTFLAILLGTLIGGSLVSIETTGILWLCGAVITVAIAGYGCSLLMPKTPSGSPELKLNFNIVRETWQIIGGAFQHKIVFFAMQGVSWFWFFGAVFLTQIPNYVLKVLGADSTIVTLFLSVFSLGIGVGSILCNKLSPGKISLRTVMIGAIGLTLFTIDLYFATPTVASPVKQTISIFIENSANLHLLFDFLMISLCGGLYIVPLMTLVQQQSPLQIRSRMIAANNIFNALYMVLASIVSIVALKSDFSIVELLLMVGLLNIPVVLFWGHKLKREVAA